MKTNWDGAKFSCAFTGPRPIKLPWGENETSPQCLELRKLLKKAITVAISTGKHTFLTGMAEGIDLIAAEEVLRLKKEGQPIYLKAVLPFAGQSKKFSPQNKLRHEWVQKQADEVIILRQNHTVDCMRERNLYLVEHAAHLIAVYDGKSGGGTKQTLRLALENRLSIEVIKPPEPEEKPFLAKFLEEDF